MLRQAQKRLVELDQARARLREGTYGRCLRCGDEIASERLDALVTASHCLRCAAEAPPR
nr:TraR/DksA C4-type zinc finger protein [Rhabdothermincola salaria]